MNPFSWAALPGWIAGLNLAAALLLGLGFYFIRRKRIEAHKRCMLAAFGCSVVFLAVYVLHHVHAGVVYFSGTGWRRALYLTTLATHTPLAALVPVLAIVTLRFGLRRDLARHRRWAAFTFPIWVYVSLTGVAVYWMLYRWQ